MRTFLDSGVLLAAWRGESLSGPALNLMADEQREFVTSQLVRLELLPRPRFEKRPREVRFHEHHFAEAVSCEPLGAELGQQAERLAALRLNAADRDAVLLRSFGSRPLAEVGARLGVTENAARMRVDGASDKPTLTILGTVRGAASGPSRRRRGATRGAPASRDRKPRDRLVAGQADGGQRGHWPGFPGNPFEADSRRVFAWQPSRVAG